MRFGMTALEFGPTVDRIVVDGVPDFSRFNMAEIVREAAQMRHLSAIELTLDIGYIIPGALSQKAIAMLGELKDEMGFTYTAHLPLWSIDLATFNQHIRRAGVECTVDAIKTTEPLQPENYVLHSSGALAAEFSRLELPGNMGMLVSGFMSTFSLASVQEILARTEIDPRRVAIENVEFPFEVTRDVVDDCGTSICFDTGHLLARYSGTESVLEFYRKHRDRITEIHLHDGSFRKDAATVYRQDHKALGVGQLPIREFLMELVRDQFKGPAIFELTTGETVRSLDVIEKVVPEALRA
jgi:sugar phosphate isomerase/epimerase